jgi:hypothetical protein
MEKIVQVDGAWYRVNTTPSKHSYATVQRLVRIPTSGVVAELLEDQGHEAFEYVAIETMPGEMRDVALALGYRFSRSRKWEALVLHHELKKVYEKR